MKTFTITTTETKPKLVIEREEFADSPRENSNIGKFITQERNRVSPDNDTYLYNLMIETASVASSREDHLERLYKAIDYPILIVPICRYEHSGVKYMTGFHHGWDYSNCGFYFITVETFTSIFPDKCNPDETELLKIVESEIDTYNKYLNGDVYCFTLFNDEGEKVDSCTGFYSLEDMKDYLPEEWENEDLEEYLKD